MSEAEQNVKEFRYCTPMREFFMFVIDSVVYSCILYLLEYLLESVKNSG